jgi:hypothetical protein
MTSEEEKELVRRYIDALNSGRLDEFEELLTPDYDDHTTMPGIPPGREGAMIAHKILTNSFPDTHFTIDELYVEGDKAVLIATGRGTHTGDFFGVPPTGKTVSWWGIRILRLADGKIAEGWALFDQRGIMQQLGIIPSGGPG